MQHLAQALNRSSPISLRRSSFAILLATTHNVFLATGLGIALGIAQVAFQKLRGKDVVLMQWLSLALVVVFGSLTLYFHDPRFVMVKFTIGHVANRCRHAATRLDEPLPARDRAQTPCRAAPSCSTARCGQC